MEDQNQQEEFSFLGLFFGLVFFGLIAYGTHLFLAADSFSN